MRIGENVAKKMNKRAKQSQYPRKRMRKESGNFEFEREKQSEIVNENE